MTRQREYSRDPLDILIEREERTCKGCSYEKTERVFDVKIKICAKGRRYGKKCSNYKERE